jgi:signal transduction histidine kinase
MGGAPVDASRRDGGELAARPAEWVPTQSVTADDWLRGMLAGSQFAAGELPLPVVLRGIVATACTLIGARYGSLGLLGADRDLEELSLVGLSPEEIARIGILPHSRGVFAALIAGNAPIRVPDVGSDPRSCGFPEHHPPMSALLGVPVRVRDETIAILYLAEPEDGEFSDKDEALLSAVATAAGAAIDNARRLAEARRSKRWMQASTEITRHLLTGDVADPLSLVASAAAEIADADLVTVVVPFGDGQRVRVEVAAGLDAESTLVGIEFPAASTLSGQVIADGEPRLIADLAAEDKAAPAIPPFYLGPSMMLPLAGMHRVRGALCLGRVAGRAVFTTADLETAAAFANHAALAMEISDARADRSRVALLEDRDRIARALNDDVIERLFSAGMSLQLVLAQTDSPAVAQRLAHTVDDLDDTIRQIRRSVFALQARTQPPSLRDRLLAVVADLTPLLGFDPSLHFDGPIDTMIGDSLADDLTACLQEALRNVVGHANATRVDISISASPLGQVTLVVSDDGAEAQEPIRSGDLSELRRRAEQRGGTLSLTTVRPRGGTELRWRSPAP